MLRGLALKKGREEMLALYRPEVQEGLFVQDGPFAFHSPKRQHNSYTLGPVLVDYAIAENPALAVTVKG